MSGVEKNQGEDLFHVGVVDLLAAGDFGEAGDFSLDDLFVPEAGAGDGFGDGLATGVGADLAVADDQAQGAALGDMTEGTVDRGTSRQA